MSRFTEYLATMLIDGDWIMVDNKSDYHALASSLDHYIDKYQPYHLIKIDDSGTTLQHPISERVNGTLFDCDVYEEVVNNDLPQGTYQYVYGRFVNTD